MKEVIGYLVNKGVTQFFSAVNKYIKDGQVIKEIENTADNLFLSLSVDNRYRLIESVKEKDIYDIFVRQCLNRFDDETFIDEFIYSYYSNIVEEDITFVKNFFESLRNIIFNCKVKFASEETRLIIQSQKEIAKNKYTSANNFRDTYAVTYSANMQNARWLVSRYQTGLNNCEPKDVIDISQNNYRYMPSDGEKYWEEQGTALVENCNRKVGSLLDDGKSISIFALAPIPLLILLGRQFANRPGVDIYQLRKNPSTWAWEENDGKLNIQTTILNENINSSEGVLILSFSGKVSKDNVKNTVDYTKVFSIEMEIENPYDDFLKSKNQLNEFLIEYRKVKEQFNAKGIKTLHLFAAIPISFAFGIGMTYNCNFDYDIVAYDYKNPKYTAIYKIGETYEELFR